MYRDFTLWRAIFLGMRQQLWAADLLVDYSACARSLKGVLPPSPIRGRGSQENGVQPSTVRSGRGTRHGFRAAIHVIEAHDVILAYIVPALHFNQN